MDGRGTLEQKSLLGKDSLETFLIHIKKIQRTTVDQFFPFVSGELLQADVAGVHLNTFAESAG